MKFETILKYLVDEIKTDLNDIETMYNSPKVQRNTFYRSIKECMGSIRDKLDMLCEE